MNPESLILVFISFWSISAVGAYLAVVGVDNLQRRYRQGRGPGTPMRDLMVKRLLFEAWDTAVLLLGFVLIVSGVLFLYVVVYG